MDKIKPLEDLKNDIIISWENIKRMKTLINNEKLVQLLV